MSQLSVELNNSTLATIEEQAKAVGISPAKLVRDLLEQQFSGLRTNKPDVQTRFEDHFGVIDLGHPLGSDNESIDDDLATAYAF